MAHFT